MSVVAVGVLVAVVCTLVFFARSLHKYDDTLYSRLPHDKDLQVNLNHFWVLFSVSIFK